MTKKTLILLLGLAFCLLGCAKNPQAEKDNAPLFSLIDSDNEEYITAVKRAKAGLPHFIEEIKSLQADDFSNVKIYIPQSENNGAFVWLIHPEFSKDSCTAVIFEIPKEFQGLKEGMKLTFSVDDIEDWYILYANGDLKGGYTIRYQRESLSKSKQQRFDQYIGAKKYIQ